MLSNLKIPDNLSYKVYAVRLWRAFPFSVSHVYSNHWKIFSLSNVSRRGTDSQMFVQLQAPAWYITHCKSTTCCASKHTVSRNKSNWQRVSKKRTAGFRVHSTLCLVQKANMLLLLRASLGTVLLIDLFSQKWKQISTFLECTHGF